MSYVYIFAIFTFLEPLSLVSIEINMKYFFYVSYQ